MIPQFTTVAGPTQPTQDYRPRHSNATVRRVPDVQPTGSRQELDTRGSVLLQGEVGDPQSVWQRAGDFRRRGNPDGKPIIMVGDQEIDCTRTTTWISVLDDKSTLNQWNERKLLEGVAEGDFGLLGELQGLVREQPEDYRYRVRELGERFRARTDAHDAREYGTQQHKFVEQTINTGEVPEMPDVFRTDHEAIMAALEPFEIVGSEIPGVNADLGVAGTMDLLVRLNGRVYTADLKTGSFNPQSVAMQLAVYSSMNRYDVVTDEMLPLLEDGTPVNRQVGFCIHAPKGKGWAKIRPINLIQGQQDVELARQVHAARKVRVANYTMDFGPWTSQGKHVRL